MFAVLKRSWKLREYPWEWIYYSVYFVVCRDGRARRLKYSRNLHKVKIWEVAHSSPFSISFNLFRKKENILISFLQSYRLPFLSHSLAFRFSTAVLASTLIRLIRPPS